MFHKSFVALMLPLALVLTACEESNGSITSPDQNVQPVQNIQTASYRAAQSVNQNTWETIPVIWQSSCTGRLYTGTLKLHLQSSSKTSSDGTQTFTEHLNGAEGRLIDADGNEYIFQENGTIKQFSFPSQDWDINVVLHFKVISKGSGPNEFLDLKLGIHSDSGNITVTFSIELNCRTE